MASTAKWEKIVERVSAEKRPVVGVVDDDVALVGECSEAGDLGGDGLALRRGLWQGVCVGLEERHRLRRLCREDDVVNASDTFLPGGCGVQNGG